MNFVHVHEKYRINAKREVIKLKYKEIQSEIQIEIQSLCRFTKRKFYPSECTQR